MLHSFILLLPCFVCVFWGIIFLSKREKSYWAQRVLTVNLFVAGASFYVIARSFEFDGNYIVRCVEDIVYTFTGLLVFPLYMLYFRFLADDSRLRWWEYLFFLPSLITGGIVLVGYWVMGKEGAICYARDILYNYSDVSRPDALVFRIQYFVGVTLFNWQVFLQSLATIIYALVNLKRWRQKLDEFYSDLEGKSVHNNYIILASIGVSFLVTGSFLMTNRTYYISSEGWVACIFVSFAACSYLQAYAGYHLKCTTEDISHYFLRMDEEMGSKVFSGEAEPKAEYPAVGRLDKNRYPAGLQVEFERLLEKDRIYLQSDLRLDDVVRLMGTNRTYISRLINEAYRCSFSDLINRYRVNYAKRLMIYSGNLSLEGVALQSGFQHLSGFSRTFKRITGVTPGSWQKVKKEWVKLKMAENLSAEDKWSSIF